MKDDVEEKQNACSKNDKDVQTDSNDLSKVIQSIVNARLKQLQTFDTQELQEKIKHLESENGTLKRRANVLEKRLIELEKDKKEIEKVRRTSLQSENTQVQKEIVETISIDSEDPKDIGFCPPLFRPATKQLHPKNGQRERLPTQMVPPLTNIENQKVLLEKRHLNKKVNTPEVNHVNHPKQISTEKNMRLEYPTMLLEGKQIRDKNPVIHYRPLTKSDQQYQFHSYMPRMVDAQHLQHPPILTNNRLNFIRARSPRLPPPYPDSFNIGLLPPLMSSITSDYNSIILKWDCINAARNLFQVNVFSYHLFAYLTDDLNTPPPADVTRWKKIGTIDALPLPIACTLVQSFEKHNYYFAVAPVDNFSRVGVFSNPCALRITF